MIKKPSRMPGGGTLPRFVAPAEAAERLLISQSALYVLLDEGGFPALRIGARRLVVPTRALTAIERATLAGRDVLPKDWDRDWPEPGDTAWLRLGEAARLLTVSVRMLRPEIDKGRFPASRVAGVRLVPLRAIDAMERLALARWRIVSAADWQAPVDQPGGTVPAWAAVPAVSEVGGAA